MIVFSNPLPGREREFDDWYTHVHVLDVLRGCPGAQYAQRFRATDDQPAGPPRYRFLAVYAGDHRGFTAGHRKLIFTSEMPISAAFDVPDHRAAYYDIVDGSDPAEAAHDDLLVARAATRHALGELEHQLGTVGVRSGLVAVSAEHQLFPQHADTAVVALYRLADPATALREGFPADAAVEVARYTPLAPRITADAARHPSPEQARRSVEVRLALNCFQTRQ